MCYCAGLLTGGKTGSIQQEVVQATNLATLRNDRVSPHMSGDQNTLIFPQLLKLMDHPRLQVRENSNSTRSARKCHRKFVRYTTLRSHHDDGAYEQHTCDNVLTIRYGVYAVQHFHRRFKNRSYSKKNLGGLTKLVQGPTEIG